jgi:hypothetical protein
MYLVATVSDYLLRITLGLHVKKSRMLHIWIARSIFGTQVALLNI